MVYYIFVHFYKAPTLHLFGNVDWLTQGGVVYPDTIFHVYKAPTLHLFGN